MITPILRLPQGFTLLPIEIPSELLSLIKEENWESLINDYEDMFKSILLNYCAFQDLELMLSIRDSAHPWEEDGIWHDDGSRVLAFSLSLTEDSHELEGGHLGIRKKGEDEFVSIPTPPFGTMIIFLTGVHGYEHKIHQVTKGRRIVLVGWCS